MIGTVGIFGAGNMGCAILRGMLHEGVIAASNVTVYDRNASKLESLQTELGGIRITMDAAAAASACDLLILAVKPGAIAKLIESIRPMLSGKAVISIAAGWTVAMLDSALSPYGASYLRVMPNTPAMVGEGMTAFCDDTTFSRADLDFATRLFEAVGRTTMLPEYLFDGVIAVSGSSPAYVFMLIEAMADAAVREGISRAQAIEMAAQSVLGAALMVLSAGSHPAALKDAVCSPGGTTIEAVATLEKNGFRHAVIEAMHACAEQSREMSK